MRSQPKRGLKVLSRHAWPPFSRVLLACIGMMLLSANMANAVTCYSETYPYPVISAPSYDLTGPDWNSQVLNMGACNDYLGVLLYQEQSFQSTTRPMFYLTVYDRSVGEGIDGWQFTLRMANEYYAASKGFDNSGVVFDQDCTHIFAYVYDEYSSDDYVMFSFDLTAGCESLDSCGKTMSAKVNANSNSFPGSTTVPQRAIAASSDWVFFTRSVEDALATESQPFSDQLSNLRLIPTSLTYSVESDWGSTPVSQAIPQYLLNFQLQKMLWINSYELLMLGTTGVTLAAIVLDQSRIDLVDPMALIAAAGMYSLAAMETYNGGDFVTVKDAHYDADSGLVFIYWQSSDQIGVTRNTQGSSEILLDDEFKAGLMMAIPQTDSELLAGSIDRVDYAFMLLKQTQSGDYNASYILNFQFDSGTAQMREIAVIDTNQDVVVTSGVLFSGQDGLFGGSTQTLGRFITDTACPDTFFLQYPLFKHFKSLTGRKFGYLYSTTAAKSCMGQSDLFEVVYVDEVQTATLGIYSALSDSAISDYSLTRITEYTADNKSYKWNVGQYTTLDQSWCPKKQSHDFFMYKTAYSSSETDTGLEWVIDDFQDTALCEDEIISQFAYQTSIDGTVISFLDADMPTKTISLTGSLSSQGFQDSDKIDVTYQGWVQDGTCALATITLGPDCSQQSLSFPDSTQTFYLHTANRGLEAQVIPFDFATPLVDTSVCPFYITINDSSCSSYDLCQDLANDSGQTVFQLPEADYDFTRSVYRSYLSDQDGLYSNQRDVTLKFYQSDQDTTYEFSFVVSINDACADSNQFTTNVQEDLLYPYEAGNPSQSVDSLMAQAISYCNVDHTLEVQDSSDSSWSDITYSDHEAVVSFSDTSGSLYLANPEDNLYTRSFTFRRSAIPFVDPASSSVQDSFTVEFEGVCLYNSLSLASSLAQLEHIVSSSEPTVITPDVNTADARCLTQYSLQIEDLGNYEWYDYAANAADYPWISHFDTSSGVITVASDDRALGQQTFHLKLKAEDLDSRAANTIVYDEFDVSFALKCKLNELRLASPLDAVYYFYMNDQTPTTVTLDVNSSIEGCPLDYKLYKFDSSTLDWVEMTSAMLDALPELQFSDGTATLDSSDYITYNRQSLQVKIEASDPDSVAATATVSASFTLEVFGSCYENEISMAEIGTATYQIDSLTPTQISPRITPVYAVCDQISYALQIYNDAIKEFQVYDSADSRFAFVSDFSATSGQVQISTTADNESTFLNTDWLLRVTATDTLSINSNAVSNQTFTVEIRSGCSENVISLIDGSFEYFLGSGEQVAAQALTASISVCPLEFTLEIHDTSSDAYVQFADDSRSEYVLGFDGATGEITVFVAAENYAKYLDHTENVRVNVTDPQTLHGENFFSVTYELRIREQCFGAQIVSSIGNIDGFDGTTFEVEQYQEIVLYFTKGGINYSDCPIRYSVTYDDEAQTAVTGATFTYTEGEAGAIMMSGAWTEAAFQERTFILHQYSLDIQELQIITEQQLQFTLSVRNPCLRTDAITPQVIGDLDYWIKDDALTVTFTDFADHASTSYPAYGPDICGPKSYLIFDENLFVPFNSINYPKLTDFLSYSVSDGTHSLTVQTSDVSIYTNEWKTFYVRVQLDDYATLYPDFALHYEAFRVRLKNCQVASFNFDPVDSFMYNLYTPVVHVAVPEFEQVPTDMEFTKSAEQACGYAVNYSATWLSFYQTSIELPDAILWNEGERRFEIFSESLDTLEFTTQVFTVQLMATISKEDMNPPHSETLSFTVEFRNECIEDQIAIISTAEYDPFIYYLGEDTEWPDLIPTSSDSSKLLTYDIEFTQTVPGCPVAYSHEIWDEASGAWVAIADSYDGLMTVTQADLTDKLVPWVDQEAENSVFNYNVAFQSDDKSTWDLTEAVMQVSLTSSRSQLFSGQTAAASFNITFKDVCWDLPLTAPTLVRRRLIRPFPSDLQVITEVNEDIGLDQRFEFTNMDTQWGDYCGGFTYSVAYLDGPQEGTRQSLMEKVFQWDGDDAFVFGRVYQSWSGVHTIAIRGQNGNFNHVDSRSYTIEFVDPCTDSTITQVPGLDATIIVNQKSSSLSYNYFGNANDTVSLTYGVDLDGISLCGDRVMTVSIPGAPALGEGETDSNAVPFLYFEITATDFPDNPYSDLSTVWEITINPDVAEEFLGTHEVQVFAALKNYPQVAPSITTFTLIIDPCAVSNITAPGQMNVEYTIGARAITASYNFQQTPCAYAMTYTAALKGTQSFNVTTAVEVESATERTNERSWRQRGTNVEGDSNRRNRSLQTVSETATFYEDDGELPNFMVQLSDQPTLVIFTTDIKNAGSYNLQVCAVLFDYLYQWGQPDNFIEDEATLGRKFDPDAPPSNLVYRNCFTVEVTVKAPSSGQNYMPELNSAPMLATVPRDLYMVAGDLLEHDFGASFDTEGDEHTVSMLLGNARRFAVFQDGVLTVPEGQTSNSTAGFYLMRVIVEDSAPEDRGGSLQTSYDLTLFVLFRPQNYTGPIGEEIPTPKVDQFIDVIKDNDTDPIIDEPADNDNGDGGTGSTDGSIIDGGQAGDTNQKPKVQPKSPEQIMREKEADPEPDIVLNRDEYRMTSQGEAKISFPEPLQVPAGYETLDTQQVAFPQQSDSDEDQANGRRLQGNQHRKNFNRNLRNEGSDMGSDMESQTFQQQTETLLTETGYRDFSIKPAMEIQVVSSITGEIKTIDFDWQITEFEGEYMQLKLDFADPSQVSAEELDNLRIIFWNRDTFKLAATGESLPIGYKIDAPLAKQISPQIFQEFTFYGEVLAYVIAAVVVIGVLLTFFCEGSLIPCLGLAETLTLVSHMPLVAMRLPGELVSFLKPVNDLMRLNLTNGWNRAILDHLGVTADETIINNNFFEAGYVSSCFLPNCATIIASFAIVIGIAAFFSCIDFFRDRLNLSTSSTRNKYSDTALRAVTRFFWIFLLELMLCSWTSLAALNRPLEDNIDPRVSTTLSILTILITALAMFFSCLTLCPKNPPQTFYKDALTMGLNQAHLQRSGRYLVCYMLRRLIFVVIVVHMGSIPPYQGLFLLLTSLGMLVAIGSGRPCLDSADNCMLMFNEFGVFLLTGMLLAFADLVPLSAGLSDSIVWVFMGAMCTLLIVGEGAILKTSVDGYLHSSKVRRARHAWEQTKLTAVVDLEVADSGQDAPKGFILQDSARPLNKEGFDPNEVSLNIVNEADESYEDDGEESGQEAQVAPELCKDADAGHSGNIQMPIARHIKLIEVQESIEAKYQEVAEKSKQHTASEKHDGSDMIVRDNDDLSHDGYNSMQEGNQRNGNYPLDGSGDFNPDGTIQFNPHQQENSGSNRDGDTTALRRGPGDHDTERGDNPSEDEAVQVVPMQSARARREQQPEEAGPLEMSPSLADEDGDNNNNDEAEEEKLDSPLTPPKPVTMEDLKSSMNDAIMGRFTSKKKKDKKKPKPIPEPPRKPYNTKPYSNADFAADEKNQKAKLKRSKTKKSKATGQMSRTATKLFGGSDSPSPTTPRRGGSPNQSPRSKGNSPLRLVQGMTPAPQSLETSPNAAVPQRRAFLISPKHLQNDNEIDDGELL